MPGNGFALAVRVGREDQAVIGLECRRDIGQALGGLAVHLPVHLEIFVGADGAILGRQVADMAIGGQDGKILAEILVDGLGLGRGFDDDDSHSGS